MWNVEWSVNFLHTKKGIKSFFHFNVACGVFLQHVGFSFNLNVQVASVTSHFYSNNQHLVRTRQCGAREWKVNISTGWKRELLALGISVMECLVLRDFRNQPVYAVKPNCMQIEWELYLNRCEQEEDLMEFPIYDSDRFASNLSCSPGYKEPIWIE